MNDKHNYSYPRIGLLIDGEWIYDRPPLCDVENPSDETILGQVPKASQQDLQNALESSARGFEIWRKTPPSERAAIMRRTAALVRERAAEIAPIFTLELGKTLSESLAEIERSATFLDWDAEELRRLYGRIVPTDPPIQQFVVREPVGPVAAFTPWNVPMSAPSRKISASLAAGCSVILKPAEETPATACLFAQCFLDAGLPKGVLNFVFEQYVVEKVRAAMAGSIRAEPLQRGPAPVACNRTPSGTNRDTRGGCGSAAMLTRAARRVPSLSDASPGICARTARPRLRHSVVCDLPRAAPASAAASADASSVAQTLTKMRASARSAYPRVRSSTLPSSRRAQLFSPCCSQPAETFCTAVPSTPMDAASSHPDLMEPAAVPFFFFFFF